MKPEPQDQRLVFFDGAAAGWDGSQDPAERVARLKADLQRFGPQAGEAVLDLGCGTGILLPLLLERVGPSGRVLAVDFAPAMAERARARSADPRLEVRVGDATALPCGDGSQRRVLCYNAWPHFPRPQAVLAELCRVLAPGGEAHIWHHASREAIAAIHRHVGGAVIEDRLPRTEVLSCCAKNRGLEVIDRAEDEDFYLVSLRRGAKACCSP